MLEANKFLIIRMHANVSLNLTKKSSQDVQLELLQHHIKSNPDQLKGVQENEAKRFCFALTL